MPKDRRTAAYKGTLFLACLALGVAAGVFFNILSGWVQQELSRAAISAGLSQHEVQRTISSAERFVRESGAVRVPVSLSAQQSVAPSPQPAEHQPDEMGALRHLAAVWSDHPDYREEWAVLLSSTRTDAAAQRA